MKSFTIILMLFPLLLFGRSKTSAVLFPIDSSKYQSSLSLQNDFFLWFLMKKNKVEVEWEDGRKEQYQIIRENGRIVLEFIEEKRIVMYPEKEASLTCDLVSEIATRFIFPEGCVPTQPVITALLIIDEEGNVISRGLKMPCLEEHFNLSTISILKDLDLKAVPAEDNDEKVASILSVELNFYSSQFR